MLMRVITWRPYCKARDVEAPDRHRGPLPEIRSADTGIRFILTIALPFNKQYRLAIRCERDGEIYASIRSGDD
jgi:hypothetical protein